MISYTGIDNIERQTNLHFDPGAGFNKRQQGNVQDQTGATGWHVQYQLHLGIFLICQSRSFEPYFIAYDKIKSGMEKSKEMIADIYTDNEQFNNWINRSKSDVLSLLVQTSFGSYPYAGVPWYNTVFAAMAPSPLWKPFGWRPI